MASAFINPSSLSFASSSFSPASPAPSSSYTHDDDEHDDIDPTHASGPARKRARTSASSSSKDSAAPAPSISEQRKEARAHRNRIAAQNSRDRRKAQFGYLERRVAELEEENRRLRAGMGIVPVAAPAAAATPAKPVFAAPSSVPISLSTVEDHLRAQREHEREKENEELKERIKTLERGWDAVVKALAAQGVAAGLLGPAQSQQPQPSSTPVVAAPPPSQPSQPFTAFPSPAPSHSSLDHELSATSPIPDFSPSIPSQSQSSSPSQTQTQQLQASNAPTHSDSTRHLARVATTGGPLLARSVSLQRVVSVEAAAEDSDNDKAMEALFREILASPRASHAAVPVKGAAAQVSVSAIVGAGAEAASGGAGEAEEKKDGEAEAEAGGDSSSADESAVVEWANEIEMQRMLDNMIMGIQGDESGVMLDLDLDMDMSMGMGMGMNVDLGLDMDLGMAFDGGVGVEYARAGWDVGGAGVF
ncbi:hypothetical protein GALMADRAFT_161615 [Galerina marginata CBS 339.88]|uniref:X-box-binding protein 1 n=1 Tax=Galerina marginata (strain CBS 339.88) TaxID=685588 RepID=A0A067SC85_GALM3|nr:hypothetical protein GALMADRAFT_161615 [Galerina marginata CBS 339.88]